MTPTSQLPVLQPQSQPQPTPRPTPPSAQNLPAFGEYLKKKAAALDKESRSAAETRAMLSMTLLRRQRGATRLDRVGFWKTDTGTFHLPANAAKLWSFNIVAPAARGIVGAAQSATNTLRVKPANAKAKGADRVAQGLAKHFERHLWNNNFRQLCFYSALLGYGYFTRLDWDEAGDGETYTTLETTPQTLTQAGRACCPSCGAETHTEEIPLMDDAGGPGSTLQTIQCRQCGEDAIVPPDEGAQNITWQQITGTAKRQGAIERTRYSAIQVRVDETAKGADLKRAEWLILDTLERRGDLEEQHPQHGFTSPAAWPKTLKWLRELETGHNQARAGDSSAELQEDDLFPVQYVYLSPKRYRLYTFSAPFQQAAQADFPALDIPAQARALDVFPQGLCAKVENEKVVAVRPASIAQEWGYGGYGIDPETFWMTPNHGLAEQQRAVNTLWTNHISQTLQRRAAIVIREGALGAEDFERGLIKVPNDYEDGLPVSQLAHNFQSGSSFASDTTLLSFILNQQEEQSGSYRVAQGVSQPNETLGAVQLQAGNSQKQLKPILQSEAVCKCAAFSRYLSLVQQHWSEEQFQSVREEFGEEWRREDLEAFLERDESGKYTLNVWKHFVTEVEPGTDAPTSDYEQTLALTNLLNLAGPLAVPGGPVPPEALREILVKLSDLTRSGIDLGREGAQEDLEAARWAAAQAFVAQVLANQPGAGQMPDLAQAFVAQLVGAPAQIDPATGAALAPSTPPAPGFAVHAQAERHDTGANFWKEKALQLITQAAQGEPNLLLEAICQAMLEQHRAGGVAAQQQQVMDGLEAQAPVEEHQQGLEEEAMLKQKALEGDASNERENQAVEAQAGREHQERLKGAELTDKEEARRHEAREKEKDRASQEKMARSKGQRDDYPK